MTSAEHRDACFVVEPNLIRACTEAGAWEAAGSLARMNAITCCKAAEHGWPGGSLSVMDIMLALELPNDAKNGFDRVVLSKGHAAAAQYAALHAKGVLSTEMLLSYKSGTEAHADLWCDTGSLGQGLSTALGMAIADRCGSDSRRTAVVLGDGELQEGQNYEALMKWRHVCSKGQRPQLVALIDRNGFQSDNQCDEIMPIHDLPTVLRGFGFSTREIDGNDPKAVRTAIEEGLAVLASSVENVPPPIIICNTTKNAGTALMPTEVHPVTKMEWQPWHTRIPPWPQYAKFIDEQLVKAMEAAVASSSKAAVDAVTRTLALWEVHRTSRLGEDACAALPNTHRPSFRSLQGTGAAFGQRLCQLLADGNTGSNMHLISMDLAGSCGINPAVGHARFHECGVAEQNGCSIAAGLATNHLPAQIPGRAGISAKNDANPRNFVVLCTYSNFLKRCYENIFINAVSKAHCVYAGFYSGLCYHTDGKSHQSINDTSALTAIPGMLAVDPLSASHAVNCLNAIHAKQPLQQSVYFRLRRTPNPVVAAAVEAATSSTESPLMPIYLKGTTKAKHCFLVMGTVAADLALRCADLPEFKSTSSVIATPALCTNATPQQTMVSDMWEGVLASLDVTATILTIEDDAGALANAISREVATRQEGQFSLHSIMTPSAGPSTRTIDTSLEFHGFTVQHVRDILKSTTP